MNKFLKVLVTVFVVLFLSAIVYKYFFPSQTCVQVLVSATNRFTGEEKVFGDPCSVPFWYKEVKDYNPEPIIVSSSDTPEEYLAKQNPNPQSIDNIEAPVSEENPIEPTLVMTINLDDVKVARTLEETNESTGDFLTQWFTLSSGDFAYTIISNPRQSTFPSLFLNGKKIADNVSSVREIAGKLVYVIYDEVNDTLKLFYDNQMVATAPISGNLNPWFSASEIDGKLVYTVTNKSLTEDTLFYDKKEIATGPNIKNIQKTSGGISYVTSDVTHRSEVGTETLFYNGRVAASEYRIEDYLEDDTGGLAYVTESFLDKIPKQGEFYAMEDYPTIMTLFYNGKEIAQESQIYIKKISGKLTYITRSAGGLHSELYYDWKLLKAADDIFSLSDILDQPAYVVIDYNTDKTNMLSAEQKLFLGENLVLTAGNKNNTSLWFSEIAGRLTYSVLSPSTQTESVYFGDQKLPDRASSYTLKEIGGKLAYLLVNQSQIGSIYYDDKKVSSNYNVQDYTVSKVETNSIYFTTADIKNSSIIISIYKVNLQ